MTIFDEAMNAARAVIENEYARLRSLITELEISNAALMGDIDHLTLEIQGVRATYDAVVSSLEKVANENSALKRQNEALIVDNAALRAEIERLKALVPVVEVTKFGADATGTSSQAQTNVIAKYGDGSAIRQFFTGLPQIAPRNAKASVVHASWKPASVAAITPEAVTAATANLKPGDCVEVWHEIDKKVRDGQFTKAEGIARKNKFYDVVKAVRPDLLVVNTLTGWELEPNNSSTKGNIDQWAEIKADLLGVDCDGVHGWPYPNYDSEIQTAVNFVKKFPSYKGWTVPEFGTSRNAANDASGINRASWAASYAGKFKAAGAKYVCLYTYESTPGNDFTTDAEVNTWRGIVSA